MIPHQSSKRVATVGFVVAMIALILGGLLFFRDQGVPLSPTRLTVATTIFPLADITQNIAGDDVRVIQLLPSGASPHSYSIQPQQLIDISDAKVLFIVGHNIDDWASTALGGATQIPIVTVDTGIQLREFEEESEHEDEEEADEHGHEEGGLDPHYWLTIPNAKIIATTIAQTLSEIDPDNAAIYTENLATYLAELDDVETELQAQAKAASVKEFIATHNAWSYMADQYGFELLATYEPVEGKEPTISDIQRLQALVAEHGIRTFYTEPAEHSVGATKFFEDNLGLEVRVLDDLGGTPPRDSYINIMRENIKALSQ